MSVCAGVAFLEDARPPLLLPPAVAAAAHPLPAFPRPLTPPTPPAEKRVGEYAKAGVGSDATQAVFRTDEEF